MLNVVIRLFGPNMCRTLCYRLMLNVMFAELNVWPTKPTLHGGLAIIVLMLPLGREETRLW